MEQHGVEARLYAATTPIPEKQSECTLSPMKRLHVPLVFGWYTPDTRPIAFPSMPYSVIISPRPKQPARKRSSPYYVRPISLPSRSQEDANPLALQSRLGLAPVDGARNISPALGGGRAEANAIVAVRFSGLPVLETVGTVDLGIMSAGPCTH